MTLSSSQTIVLLVATGAGVGLAAAFLTALQIRRPVPGAPDAERQDSLERLKIWTEFWKYFLVSFALVLITSLLGNLLKERELDLQNSKQASDLALAKAKGESEILMNENTNLGSFLNRALDENWEQQFLFASYFGYVTRDADARARWKEYAKFIADTKKETAKAQSESKQIAAESKQLPLSDPKQLELTKRLDELESKLELNKALLQPKKALDVSFFRGGLSIDADGAPKAYHPDNSSGLDYLGNAGRPGQWWALVIDEHAQPVVQGPNDPAPGYYISPTGLVDDSRPKNDPLRYVDSTKIPYVALPSKQARDAGIKLGDFAAVVNLANQQLCYAIYADPCGPNQSGQGSIALAQALGVPANPKSGGTSDGVVYKVFAGSGNGKPRTLEEINREGERLLKAWGSKELMIASFKDDLSPSDRISKK
jgi:hypothetical protein